MMSLAGRSEIRFRTFRMLLTSIWRWSFEGSLTMSSKVRLLPSMRAEKSELFRVDLRRMFSSISGGIVMALITSLADSIFPKYSEILGVKV